MSILFFQNFQELLKRFTIVVNLNFRTKIALYMRNTVSSRYEVDSTGLNMAICYIWGDSTY